LSEIYNDLILAQLMPLGAVHPNIPRDLSVEKSPLIPPAITTAAEYGSRLKAGTTLLGRNLLAQPERIRQQAV